jgi:RNA polymerase sigma factor (sigma-70 family)
VNEPRLLDAARAGDEEAFARLTEPHRRALHAHCYRMLGSVTDAEDALQEALFNAWRGLPRFEGRSSLRSWLYTIATNACLRAIERRPKRVLPIDYGPAADPHDGLDEPLIESVWVEPYPDEALGLEDGLAGLDARMSSARASSSRSSRRSSTCRRASARCSFCATCSAFRRARWPRCSRRARPRSTARCSVPTRRSTSACPSAASRRCCGR